MRYQLVADENAKDFFDFVASVAQGLSLELEVAGLDIGDQIEDEWVLLDELFYDSRKAKLYLGTGRTEHWIDHPHSICLGMGEETGALRSISMKDESGHLQILNFRRPLLLSAPGAWE